MHQRRRGDRLSAKAASQVKAPYVVSWDEKLWSNRPTFTKAAGTSIGFGSQLQIEDGGQRAYAVAAPLLLLGSLLCALLASVGQDAPGRFLWAASACFTAAAAWPAPRPPCAAARPACGRAGRSTATRTRKRRR